MLEDKWLNAMVVQALFREFGAEETYSYPQVQSCYLVWCRTGRGQIEINGKMFSLVPGRFLIAPWNHAITYLPDLDHPYTLGCIHVIPNMEETGDIHYSAFHSQNQNHPSYQLRHNEFVKELKSVSAFQLTEESPLLRLSTYVVERYIKQAPEDQLRLFARMLLYEIYETSLEEDFTDCMYPPAFQKMLDHIDNYLEMPIELEQLCFHSHWSVPSIYRSFRKYLNTTPGKYIQERRLRHAARTLRENTIRIAELSRNLQFPSPGYFSRCFKALFGISPREYRENPQSHSMHPEPRRRPRRPVDDNINQRFLPKFIPDSSRKKVSADLDIR